MGKRNFIGSLLFLVFMAFLNYGQETASQSTSSEQGIDTLSIGNPGVTLRNDFWKGLYIDDRRVLTQQDREEFKEIISTCPNALKQQNSSDAFRIYCLSLMVVGSVFNTVAVLNDFNPALHACGAAAFGMSLTFAIGSATKQDKAILYYNTRQCNLREGERTGGFQLRKVQ